MKLIYPEQLFDYIKYDTYFFYVLVGNDFFLIKENKDYIKYYFYKKNFIIHNNLQIVCNTSFHNITNLFKTNDLFNYKHCFIITINNTCKSNIKKEFILLCAKLVSNKLCIIFYYEDNYNYCDIVSYFKYISINTLIVNCNTIPKNRLLNWLKSYSNNNNVVLNKCCFKYLEKLYNSNLEFIINLIKILKTSYPKNYNIDINNINTYLCKYNNNTYDELDKIINILFKKNDINIISIIKILFNYQEESSILVRLIQNKLMLIIHNKFHNKKNISNIEHVIYFDNEKIKNIINILYNMELDIKCYKNKFFFINIIKLVMLLYFN
ncbi:MAG: hypothetical protein N4P96_00325 [Candidatus Lightella neohaematopini]|nr:hypothetical protein [Candidatus Lightella neohaematopini]